MRKRIDRRPMAIDVDHMRMLHEEAIEQLDLMKTVVDASQSASGTMRDTLENMVEDHWHAYMDVLHMICMHDTSMSEAMNKQGITLRESQTLEADSHLGTRRHLLLPLISALSRRHRRIWYIYGLRGNPMNDYLQDSLAMERDHMAELTSMIETIL